jgi:hypothetical protein
VDVLAVPPVANVALFSRKSNQNPINKTFSDDYSISLSSRECFYLHRSKRNSQIMEQQHPQFVVKKDKVG